MKNGQMEREKKRKWNERRRRGEMRKRKREKVDGEREKISSNICEDNKRSTRRGALEKRCKRE